MQIYKRQIELYDMPVPWLLGICFDCTVSINERDFATAQDEVAMFLSKVHRRSHMLPGLPSGLPRSIGPLNFLRFTFKSTATSSLNIKSMP